MREKQESSTFVGFPLSAGLHSRLHVDEGAWQSTGLDLSFLPALVTYRRVFVPSALCSHMVACCAQCCLSGMWCYFQFYYGFIRLVVVLLHILAILCYWACGLYLLFLLLCFVHLSQLGGITDAALPRISDLALLPASPAPPPPLVINMRALLLLLRHQQPWSTSSLGLQPLRLVCRRLWPWLWHPCFCYLPNSHPHLPLRSIGSDCLRIFLLLLSLEEAGSWLSIEAFVHRYLVHEIYNGGCVALDVASSAVFQAMCTLPWSLCLSPSQHGVSLSGPSLAGP